MPDARVAKPDPIVTVIDELLAKMTPHLGLDRWQIKREVGPGETTACCSAMPEYRVALISIDPDRLQTGDELDETLAHELMHALLWPLAAAADDLRIAVGEMMPEDKRAAMNRYLEEQVRLGEERTATDVGRAVVSLFRALWKAEAELAAARKEVTALKRQARETAA